MAECLRVLKPGCEFSLCVPNARFYLEAYIKGVEFRDKDSCWKPGYPDQNTFMDQVNYIAYMGGQHNYMFDNDNAISMMNKAGFIKVSERKFDASVDSINRDFESIYFSAYKDQGS